MAKRKPRKSKRPALAVKANLTLRRYNQLKKEAENARKRIRNFEKSSDSRNYFAPDINDYLLTTLISRLAAGESFKSVMGEIKSLTAANIKSGTFNAPTTASGYVPTAEEVSAVKSAVASANANIRAAKKKYAGAADIMPDEFTVSDIMQNVVDSDSIKNKVKDLGLFTPENLEPTAVTPEGEAGTQAEYQYYRNILERENERRARVRAENDPRTQEGYFLQETEYESRDINIDAIPDLPTLKKRAQTWDDPARVYRANQFLVNYSNTLRTFQGVLINNGYYNKTIEDRFNFIYDVIAKLYYNEKAITYASTRQLNIDIALISDVLVGDVDFDAIYEAWTEIDDRFF